MKEFINVNNSVEERNINCMILRLDVRSRPHDDQLEMAKKLINLWDPASYGMGIACLIMYFGWRRGGGIRPGMGTGNKGPVLSHLIFFFY